MRYNFEKLDHELQEAGFPVSGISPKKDGTPDISYERELTAEEKLKESGILLGHTPTFNQEERSKEFPRWDFLICVMYYDQVHGTNKFKKLLEPYFNKWPMEYFEIEKIEKI